MAPVIDFLKPLIGQATGILVMILAFDLIQKGVAAVDGGVVNGIGKSQGLVKKAQGFADYRRNQRTDAALRGGRGLGSRGIRRRERTALRNQAAEHSVKSGQAQFGVADPDAAKYVQSMAQSQAQVSAINSANNSKFVNSVARTPGLVSEGMNSKAATDSDVLNSLQAQQARAVADAIKDVQLTSNVDRGSVAAMGAELERAIKGGDSITARAMQNMLMSAGSKGTKEYRDRMTGIAPGDMKGSTEQDLKRNLLDNHSSVKNSAADIIKHAATGAGTTMGQVSTAKGTWDNMADEELVGQKTHSLELAEAAGGISQTQAKAIFDDKRLYGKLDPGGKAIIDRLK